MHMKRAGMVFSCLLVLAAPSFASAATLTPMLVPNAVLYSRADNEFASAIVVDAATGKRLYAYLPDLKWTGASLTKLMNAMVFLDLKPNWGKAVTLSSKDEVGGGRLRVNSGAKMTIQDLFYSSIVASANNTAMAMARVSGLSIANYVARMNAKAKALGMTHTTYTDPSGMDPKNVTTATDLAVLARKAFSTYMVHKASTTMSYSFPILNTNVVKKIASTNDLLTKDPDVYVYGGKTGFLYESMYNLAVEMEPNPRTPNGHKVLVIVFGSPTRAASFASAKSLAQWAWKSFEWK